MEYNDFAKCLLESFVRNSEIIYGRAFVSYNVHSLVHIPDYVKVFGPIDSFSAFVFENYNGVLKRLLRKNDLPLQQIVKRISEVQNNVILNKSVPSDLIKFKREHSNGPTIETCNGSQFNLLEWGSLVLTCYSPDNTVILVDQRVAVIKNIIKKTATPI